MNLITGATGLVGAHVALQLLEQGKPVTAIKRKGSDVSKTKTLFSYYSKNAEALFDQLNWIDADVCDIYSLLDALDGIDTVYHCAGFVSFNSKDRKQMHKINNEGTANVVNACLEKNARVLCHVSSIATLQNPDITKNIDESVYWKSSPTASEYAISKYNGEREVWRGMEEGLQAVIVNPGVIIGPGFWHQSSGKIISNGYRGSSFYTNGSTGMIDAKDVASCMIQLVEKQQFGKRFILTENNYSFKELFSLVQKQFGKKAPSIEAGKWLLKLAQYLDGIKSLFTGKEQIITKETVVSALEKNTFNNQKIKDTLQYRFISLSDSVKFACEAYTNDLKC